VPPRLRLAALDEACTQLCLHNPQDNSLLVINMADRSVFAVGVC